MKFLHIEHPSLAFVAELEPAYRLDYFAASAEQLLGDIENSKAQFWLMQPEETEDAFGCFLTRVVERTQGKTLFIAYMVGKKIRANSEAVKKRLVQLARDMECVAIEAELAHEGLLREMFEVGFNPVTTRVRLEVRNG